MKLSCKTFIVSQYFRILQCCLHVFLSAREKKSLSAPIMCNCRTLFFPHRGAELFLFFFKSNYLRHRATCFLVQYFTRLILFRIYAPAIENYGEMSVDMCFIWSMARAAVWLGKKTSKLVENNLNEFVNWRLPKSIGKKNVFCIHLDKQRKNLAQNVFEKIFPLIVVWSWNFKLFFPPPICVTKQSSESSKCKTIRSVKYSRKQKNRTGLKVFPKLRLCSDRDQFKAAQTSSLDRDLWCLPFLCELVERLSKLLTATSGCSHDGSRHRTKVLSRRRRWWWWCCIFFLYSAVQTKRAYS